MSRRFPEGFLWGASTSAYQIEGDNRASALWDWESRAGWEPSGLAADSWRRWPQDIECLKRLSLNAYRFSVEWSRVQPAAGIWDDSALDRYAEMSRALREAGIRPIACLHHFSEPAWLLRALPDGWLHPDAPGLFADFAGRVARALAAEVADWITFNEPMVWLLWGYWAGHFPPGRRDVMGFARSFQRGPLLEHVSVAHREARAAIRSRRPGARVGIAQNISDLEPARPGPEDLEAVEDWDRFMHRDLLDRAAADGALDFVGVNYYTRVHVRRVLWPYAPLGVLPCYAEVEAYLGKGLFRLLGGVRGSRPRTEMGWEVVPEGLGRVVGRLWRDYRRPILVTENGLADSTGQRRAAYLRDHLASLWDAMREGAQVEGYLHWTLMDNYEWGSYRPLFGLYHVQRGGGFERTPAGGSEFYARVARTGELPETPLDAGAPPR